MAHSSPTSAEQDHDSSQFFADLPCPEPLPEAVAAGVFGAMGDGYHSPGEEEVRALTEEHAREMAILLADQTYLAWCLEQGIDPNSRRRPRIVARQEQLQENLAKEIAQYSERYQGCISAYADAFGYTAADQLDSTVQEFVSANDQQANYAVQRELF